MKHIKLPDAITNGAWFEKPRSTRKQGYLAQGWYTEASFTRPFYDAGFGTPINKYSSRHKHTARKANIM